MNRSVALLCTVALCAASYLAVVALTDAPLRQAHVPPGKERRAAVAIRDDVTPFQKWGSREFTLPYLTEYYGAAHYFTDSETRPQIEAFVTALDQALADYSAVDLYLLAHSNHLIDWVATIPAERRARLRLVYNTGCEDLKQGPRWLTLGAKAYVGHPGVSASPVFYVYFLRRWTRGAGLREAADEGNRLAFRAFDRVGAVSFGAVDAEQLKAESRAVVFGDDSLRIDREGP